MSTKYALLLSLLVVGCQSQNNSGDSYDGRHGDSDDVKVIAPDAQVISIDAKSVEPDAQLASDAGACAVLEPLTLTPFDVDSVAILLPAYNASCTVTGGWCQFDSVLGYNFNACSANAPQEIMDMLLANTQAGAPQGQILTTQELDASFVGRGNYQPLLSEVVASPGVVPDEHWLGMDLIQCHNCTNNLTYWLYYSPEAGQAILFQGQYGYDS